MVDALRYAEKFTSSNGGVTCTFPGNDYEYEPAQAYRVTRQSIAGADYAFDFAGSSPWPKDVGVENVRFVIWGTTAADAESQFDTLVAACREIGLGKLYTLASDATRRWCWAKLTDRPGYRVDVNQFFNLPVTLKFERYSDWFDTTETTGSQALDASPKTFTITNPGNARVRAMTLTLLSISAAGWTNPSLVNVSLGLTVSSTRDAASANSRLRIRPHIGSVQYSSDAGVNYADDYALVTLPAGQVALMELQPGDNSMSYTSDGTPSGTITWSFYSAFH